MTKKTGNAINYKALFRQYRNKLLSISIVFTRSKVRPNIAYTILSGGISWTINASITSIQCGHPVHPIQIVVDCSFSTLRVNKTTENLLFIPNPNKDFQVVTKSVFHKLHNIFISTKSLPDSESWFTTNHRNILQYVNTPFSTWTLVKECETNAYESLSRLIKFASRSQIIDLKNALNKEAYNPKQTAKITSIVGRHRLFDLHLLLLRMKKDFPSVKILLSK